MYAAPIGTFRDWCWRWLVARVSGWMDGGFLSPVVSIRILLLHILDCGFRGGGGEEIFKF